MPLRARVGWLFAAALLSVAALPVQEPVFEGERALWVRVHPDSLVVNWLQDAPAPGELTVLDERGRPLRRVTTPAGRGHRAALARPRADRVRLRYGTSGALHETVIDLRAPRRPAVAVTGVDSLYVFGDVHGEYDRLVAVLRNAGLVDDALRWSGGRKHIVFAGDLVDRGDDVIRTLWLVYRLEQEAASAGGRVHVLLGNHELMVMMNDVRYVSAKEQSIATQHGAQYYQLFNPRTSLLGRWLASKPAVVRIDRALVAHGGVASEYTALSLRQYDEVLATILRSDAFHQWGDSAAVLPIDSATLAAYNEFLQGPRSAFWFRGYAQSDSLGTELDLVLRHFGASVHVIGHTPFPEITRRYEGKLIAANTRAFADEALLLVRNRRGGYEGYRIRAQGPAAPLGSAP